MVFKRTLCVIFTLALLFVAVPMSVSAATETVTAASFNATRNEGELVVYTPEYGDSTGTNWWGAEAVVDANNQVVALGSGNSDIPAGGFVLSGHDNENEGGTMMKTWVRENVQVGDYVYFDKRTMTVTVSDTPLDLDISPFYEISHTVDGINTSRDENTLIVYDPIQGTSTKTNVHGYEVAVDKNGVILSMGGNDTPIPVGGYVLSGHGTSKDWLQNQVIEGMRAELDKDARVIRFIYDEQSLRTAVELAFADVEAAVADTKAAFIYADYAQVEAAVADAEVLFEAGADSDKAFADLCDQTLETLKSLQATLCDSRPVQYRGVWVRPSQLTAKDVDSYVKELHDAGVNVISVEGFFENGYIMELPEDSPLGRHPKFNYDVLQAYIDACHKYEMECHLWMPIMNVGYAKEGGIDRTLASVHPEWIALNQHGTTENPDGFCMIDPANAEARAYLVEFYQYLVTTYDIDGFELDYIRYYDRDELDFGYTEAAFEGFEAAYGHGVTPEYDTSAAYWRDWVQYRRDCVTEMVIAVSEMIRREAPDVLISADTAATEDNTLNQDYLRWVKEGYIDVLHQMAYGDGYGPEFVKAVKAAGDNALIVPALATTSGIMMERQAREDLSFGTYGECFFEAQGYLGNRPSAAFEKTVYRTAALAPFYDPAASIDALLSYLCGRIDDVIVPLGGMTDAEAKAVKEAASTITRSLSANSDIEALTFEALHEEITALENKTASKVLLEDLYRAEQIRLILCKDVAADNGQDAAGDDNGDLMWWIVGGAVALVVIAAVVVTVLLKKKKTA